MAYQPIENYGLVGNLRTVALVGMDGSIDWFCFPNFDSPSLFGAILDERKGGRFKIAPSISIVRNKQFYWPDTNVLITRFFSQDGVGEITDYMPIHSNLEGHGNHQLIRRVSVVRGSMPFRLECLPAFNYARDPHRAEICTDGAIFRSPSLTLGLATQLPLKPVDGGVESEFVLSEGQHATIVLHDAEADRPCGGCLSEEESTELFKETVNFWRRWISKSSYTGRWRETINRSALVLKLMTYEPTGAIVAAPTCSLPESIGGSRNWDYRYTWIRDAAFTLYGLMRIGFTDEAARFMNWLEARSAELEEDGSLQIMYGIDGRHKIDEEVLGHLEGYRGSGPVRIGNLAHRQLQLDIYGELLDSVYLYNKYGSPISYDFWRWLHRLLDYVCDHWNEPDEGIWEVRGGRRHFVYSKLMCWVALDRGIRLAEKRSFPSNQNRWRASRDAIYQEIMTMGWNRERQAFVQHYGSDSLDASNLMMPLVFFLSPDDPRMLKTLEATLRSPEKGGLYSNSLVYRYNIHETGDGLDGSEGTFNMCTFWLVEALTRAGRVDPSRLDDARLIFEQMLGHANHLGLYAEETSQSGEALGNFPQAFTHLSLISAGYNLDRALGGNRKNR